MFLFSDLYFFHMHDHTNEVRSKNKPSFLELKLLRKTKHQSKQLPLPTFDTYHQVQIRNTLMTRFIENYKTVNFEHNAFI